MQIRHLELFVAVAEEQHFSRAAEREHIVQSGISAAIRALEEEIGALLFIRSTRRVELSPTGQIFLPEARRILESVKNAKAAVAGVSQGLTGRLAIGTIESLTPLLDLPMLLRRFHKEHPQVKITVQEAHLSALEDSLVNGNLDLAFMPAPTRATTALSYEALFSSPMVAIHAKDHPFAGRASVKLSELSNDLFIDFSPRWGTRQLVDQMLESQGIERTTMCEVESYDLVSQFVLRGFGVAVIPEAMAQYRKLPYLTIEPEKRKASSFPRWEVGLVRVKAKGGLSSNPPAAIFCGFVEKAVRSARNAHASRSASRLTAAAQSPDS